MPMTTYAGKAIATLTDKQLELADEDVSNCMARAYQAPDEEKYNLYFASLSAQALAIAAEKVRR